MESPDPAEFDKRVQFRKRVDLPTFDDGVKATYPVEFSRWAKIAPVGTAVYTGSVQTESAITHRVFVWYLDGIDESFEIVRRKTVYRIKRSSHFKGGAHFTVFEVEELRHEQ